MKTKKIQLMIFFLLSMILAVSFSPLSFAQAPAPSSGSSSKFLDNTFWQNVSVAVLSAILAFLGGYALSGISKRSGSGKRLSYSSDIETELVNIERSIKEKVVVLYENKPIASLFNIRFDIENTGNSVVKSQTIRFEFSPGTKVLEFYFEPQPQPEMRVEKINDPTLRDFERKCQIGHIEKKQTVGIRFIVTSDSEVKLTPYPYNENGDIEFESRSATKTLSDRERVVRFLSLLIMYFIIPPVFSLFPLSPFSETMAGLVRLAILLALFRFIVPFSEVIAELITRLLNPEFRYRQAILQDVSVGGDLTVGDIGQSISDSKNT